MTHVFYASLPLISICIAIGLALAWLREKILSLACTRKKAIAITRKKAITIRRKKAIAIVASVVAVLTVSYFYVGQAFTTALLPILFSSALIILGAFWARKAIYAAIKKKEIHDSNKKLLNFFTYVITFCGIAPGFVLEDGSKTIALLFSGYEYFEPKDVRAALSTSSIFIFTFFSIITALVLAWARTIIKARTIWELTSFYSEDPSSERTIWELTSLYSEDPSSEKPEVNSIKNNLQRSYDNICKWVCGRSKFYEWLRLIMVSVLGVIGVVLFLAVTSTASVVEAMERNVNADVSTVENCHTVRQILDVAKEQSEVKPDAHQKRAVDHNRRIIKAVLRAVAKIEKLPEQILPKQIESPSNNDALNYLDEKVSIVKGASELIIIASPSILPERDIIQLEDSLGKLSQAIVDDHINLQRLTTKDISDIRTQSKTIRNCHRQRICCYISQRLAEANNKGADVWQETQRAAREHPDPQFNKIFTDLTFEKDLILYFVKQEAFRKGDSGESLLILLPYIQIILPNFQFNRYLVSNGNKEKIDAFASELVKASTSATDTPENERTKLDIAQLLSLLAEQCDENGLEQLPPDVEDFIKRSSSSVPQIDESDSIAQVDEWITLLEQSRNYTESVVNKIRFATPQQADTFFDAQIAIRENIECHLSEFEEVSTSRSRASVKCLKALHDHLTASKAAATAMKDYYRNLPEVEQKTKDEIARLEKAKDNALDNSQVSISNLNAARADWQSNN
ncbi:MAG TPA: hypothetical protein VGB77_04480 [Abditibacteriaceae bacterium]|jgi:hypothetical protein